MLEQYLNKPCKLTIAHANLSSGGSAPMRLNCVITKMDNEYIEIQFNANDKNAPLCFKGTSGTLLVKKDYIVCITLI